VKVAGVTASWDRPKARARAVLVLGHGAGGDLDDPLLRDVGSLLTEDGVATLRFNFPYREEGRRAPGAQAPSEDCYRSVLEAARGEGLPVFCGGKSYGGRIATHVAAAGAEVDGLVLLSYPLHPPGRPERLRDEHLGRVGAPMVFVQGTRDPFATPELLERTVSSLPDAEIVWVEGGDHSLRVRGRRPRDVAAEVAGAASRFLFG
jgi:predicted alpha/beta-hydrolase family hydrolase